MSGKRCKKPLQLNSYKFFTEAKQIINPAQLIVEVQSSIISESQKVTKL